ncbi:maleylacetate reductase [Kribbella jiaozuonensis]|uniref:Maleylacetate reductase n=1 Tax=Kribbella jiaozuonensis TaxID=2575441 RepID=A0A4U3LQW0_9ACTN|nr:maleylacetate reductase [Kribbella jiaozuonensis]TKK78100.1 maleylacetate reductase [Kribbella jiaozuonensis]
MPRPADPGRAESQAGFVHTFLPGRVVFGAGALDQVAGEVEGLGVRRALVVATKSARDAADVVEVELGDRFAGRIDGVAQHVPTAVAENARAKAREVDVDGVIAIGGGSAIGLAKAVALTGDVMIVAVPTTYAGSEMTPVWGETAGGSKTTGTDLRVLPRVVVYDPVLSQHLPKKVTAASVANAIAHCVEAVWTPRADPITEVTAVEGLRALADGLRQAMLEPTDLDARGNLLYGACLAGSAMATAGTGLHHKLCHLLGGTYNLPHAETHAAILPQVARVNAPAVPQSAARLEAALTTTHATTGNAGTSSTSTAEGSSAATTASTAVAGAGELASGLFDLFTAADVPTNLRELGLAEEQVEEAVKAFKPTDNPIPVTEDLVREILTRAWAGTRP